MHGDHHEVDATAVEGDFDVERDFELERMRAEEGPDSQRVSSRSSIVPCICSPSIPGVRRTWRQSW